MQAYQHITWKYPTQKRKLGNYNVELKRRGNSLTGKVSGVSVIVHGLDSSFQSWFRLPPLINAWKWSFLTSQAAAIARQLKHVGSGLGTCLNEVWFKKKKRTWGSAHAKQKLINLFPAMFQQDNSIKLNVDFFKCNCGRLSCTVVLDTPILVHGSPS